MLPKERPYRLHVYHTLGAMQTEMFYLPGSVSLELSSTPRALQDVRMFNAWGMHANVLRPTSGYDPCNIFATSKSEPGYAPITYTRHTDANMPHKHKRKDDNDDNNQYVFSSRFQSSSERPHPQVRC
jgi:hypothetical protein